MIYVPEILQARFDDNRVEAKAFREYLVELDIRIKGETDLKAKEGMQRVRTDIYFEYESLSKENDEIRTTLKLIKELEIVKKKKRAPSLPTRRLNSHIKFKSHASL